VEPLLVVKAGLYLFLLKGELLLGIRSVLVQALVVLSGTHSGLFKNSQTGLGIGWMVQMEVKVSNFPLQVQAIP
jgi:ribosomal protein L6P/L9E